LTQRGARSGRLKGSRREVLVHQDGLNRVLPSAEPSRPPGHPSAVSTTRLAALPRISWLLAIRDEKAAVDGLRAVVVTTFDRSNISEAKETPGSHPGSHQPQMPGDAEPRLASISPAR
jgi:hypothetical protein